MPEPQPARSARRDELEELAHSVRQELLKRGESPPAGWVEEAAQDLHAGRLPGWYYASASSRGLGFYSARGDRAFGHVHVEPGTDAVGRAERLVDAMRGDLSSAVQSLDVGFTGLAMEEERALGEALRGAPGVSLLAREAMERPIAPADAEPVEPYPQGVRLLPIRAISRDALAELDFRAFEGSIDANLIGTERAEYRRMMDELIDGRLGRFLDEASTTLVHRETGELLAALLTSEQSPQLAVYLDIMVAPQHRRHGLGRFLVRWGFRALWALGYPKVRLWVTEINQAARALYIHTGFVPVGSALIYRYSRRAAANPSLGGPAAHGDGQAI
jgi:GNAT superfamily N-acetyltransferase